MTNLIVLFSSTIFVILFLFILFIFFTIIASIITKKENYPAFEPSVSIVIPAYNEEKCIRDCMDSIKSMEYPKNKIEVIVVDDGSSDKTLNVVEEYSAIILGQEHLGKVEALNNGVMHASNDFIFTVDADTIIDRRCLKELIRPFSNEKIGATNGAIKTKESKNSFLRTFQDVEYSYNNLIRHSFSKIFKNGIWFFGAIACYRRSSLKKIGYFKRDTITEDMDIAMEMKKNGYKTLNVKNAFGYTDVPETLKEIYRQRSRWWIGGLQTLIKNNAMFSAKYGVSSLFLFINQVFWSFYALISIPIIAYQFNYWLPYNSNSIIELSVYTFRWFSFYGPVWVLYKIPANGLSYCPIVPSTSGCPA